MRAPLYHIQLNVSDAKKSVPFYKELLHYLGFDSIVDEGEDHLGISDGRTDFWILETEEKYRGNKFHRKNTGINHLAFRVAAREDVDKFVEEFLKAKGIPMLYGTPKEFPEYHEGYYAVFFEDPDRVKLEVVFIPH